MIRDPAGDAWIEVRDLAVHFTAGRRVVRAVDGVSLSVARRETVGLVGESGCGKSTLGRAILRLERPVSGQVLFRGEDTLAFRGARLGEFRKQVQMVFQDPFGSLNPRMRAGAAIEEALRVHAGGRAAERSARSAELFRLVGLDPSSRDRFPHEFSGGQRQRIGIARALAVGPSLLIADEPVSALDVSVQVQILNLLKDLRDSLNLACLFVAHDLAVVRYVSDRVLVMYLGRIVESARAADLYARPAHPYTRALLAAVPDVGNALAAREKGGGMEAPVGDAAVRAVRGCPFHPRCPRASDRCRQEAPVLRPVEAGHESACHFAGEVLSEPLP